ncbi:MAG: DUF423 domain-containing protein [Ancalomicrobiaceae bacterium]|nr:DUF423 domain-containing protein [Ancalomicrobiaceae bacterium]
MSHPGSAPDAGRSEDRIGRLLIVLASFLMAAGVVIAAAGAHAGAGRELSAASLLMTTNAPMIGMVGLGIACRKLGRASAGVGASVALVGTVLFSADMISRAYGLGSLVAYAAPTGGSLVIAGWTIVGLCGLVTFARR